MIRIEHDHFVFTIIVGVFVVANLLFSVPFVIVEAVPVVARLVTTSMTSGRRT